MARAFILVLDSFGLGATPDAADFGDVGADTFGSIARWCADGGESEKRPASGPLNIPNMVTLGLGKASELATGHAPAGIVSPLETEGLYGVCKELSKGKDTPSGHWEIAGVPVLFDWGYFPTTPPSFPEDLLNALIERCDLPGVLGNKHASGTVILEELGDEHIETGKPIVYTSADSVFQIAAHEETFGLERLYHVCDVARELVDAYNIGRVIARPFVGQNGVFERTGNRRDLATPPPSKTLLDMLKDAGREVISIGKIADIFAHQGLTQKIKATGNMALFDETLHAADTAPDGALIFTNFVDFDQSFGHRRDVPGYANALEEFDARLPELQAKLQAGDLVILTADHGCDPTWPGSDHTREHIPFIAFGPGIAGGSIGVRESFADIGQTVARHLNIAPLEVGHSALQ
ncbi:phosphopentomutase [Kordiimonas sediminis]|uniref:Phosphopentomutase n=1 Tax=Kordiimonas sediminis TaxID=1735581 RepID=A0A919EAK3_9PROT|nr:phosphopentomutase [Kordiimonas sediminis]GHF30381.1 phosphopentomutase [Kordiimonas sediminis]